MSNNGNVRNVLVPVTQSSPKLAVTPLCYRGSVPVLFFSRVSGGIEVDPLIHQATRNLISFPGLSHFESGISNPNSISVSRMHSIVFLTFSWLFLPIRMSSIYWYIVMSSGKGISLAKVL